MTNTPTYDARCDYKPEYDHAAALKRIDHSKKINPAFKKMGG